MMVFQKLLFVCFSLFFQIDVLSTRKQRLATILHTCRIELKCLASALENVFLNILICALRLCEYLDLC
jgi:hypothetical protein